MEAKKLADPRDVAVALAPALRLCGYCKTWHSKPCGEGCYLRPGDPTFEDVCRSAREAIARTPQVSTMTGGFSCPDCGGATHDQMRCTACGFSSLEEEPSNG